MLADARTSVPTDGMRLDGSTIAHWMGIDKRAPYPAAPHHPSIVVAVPCAGQQGTCSQQPANVSLQTLMYKDVGRHKARPLQLMWIYRLSEVRVFDDCAVGGRCCVGPETVPLLRPTI